MAVVNSTIGQTLTLGANSIANQATWTNGINGITAENLMKPLVELQEYFDARGFKDWTECYTYFSSVAKLTNTTFISELISADIRQWREANANRTK